VELHPFDPGDQGDPTPPPLWLWVPVIIGLVTIAVIAFAG
jgi:hypothetical protein